LFSYGTCQLELQPSYSPPRTDAYIVRKNELINEQ